MDTDLMIEGRLSVAEAAQRLDISVQRVRQLLHAGELDGRKGPGGWIVADNAVRAREQALPGVGRPLSPRMAWLVVAQLLAADSRSESAVEMDSDRRERHRLRNLLGHRGPERDWANWLSRRAEVARYWVHPGMRQPVLSDARISVSGAGAAASVGAEIVGGDVSDLYVSSDDISGVIRDYGLHADPAGQLRVHLWRAGVGAEYILRPGESAPVILAALDLLSAPDSRARRWAHERIQQNMEGVPILRTQRPPGEHCRPEAIRDELVQ